MVKTKEVDLKHIKVTIHAKPIVKDKFWDTDFLHESYECQTKCAQHRVDKNYATEW